MEDDDLFLVIVGDETGDTLDPPPIQIKQEHLDETENLQVEEVIEKVEKHGEYIQVKVEPVDEDEPDYITDECEYLDGDESQFREYLKSIEKEEPQGKDNIPDNITDNEEYESKVNVKIKRKKDNLDTRRTMLSPDEQKSFVEDLRDKYPELRDNAKLLMDTLCEIMRNVKRPPLPVDYYIVKDISPECPRCGHVTESIPAAARHYREKHGPRYLLCYACGVDFRSTTNLYKHEKRCAAPDRAIVLRARAAVLGNKGRGRPFLNYHMTMPPRVAHTPSFACSECSAVFNTKTNLMSHVYLHRGERPFQCHHCPAAYTSYSTLLRHTKKHTGIQFICDHCGRDFKVKAALVAHMDTHREIRRFGCEHCDRRFAQKSALLLHVDRVHNNLPPPYGCEICPKRYPRMTLLKDHMKNEHGLMIMTRKMFFKKLPMLSDAEMKQAAKVVFKSDAERQHDIRRHLEENVKRIETGPVREDNNYILPNHPSVDDILGYIKHVTDDTKSPDADNVFIIRSD